MTMPPAIRRSFQLLASAVLMSAAVAPVAGAVAGRDASTSPSRESDRRFHLRLVKSEPSKGEAVAASPTVIRLWYSLAPEMAVTAVTLASVDGTQIPLGAPRRGRAVKDPVEVDIKQSLPAGEYRVSWKTSSKDGHPIKGDYSFTVKAGA
jgi:methionine-rich copper-binding protein CopC